MPEAPIPSTETVDYSRLIADIYSSPFTPEDEAIVAALRAEIVPESDKAGLELYESQQARFEVLKTLEGWQRVKEAARMEIATLADDSLERVLTKAAPLIRSLPGGHSKGHFLRDAIHLAGDVYDPWYAEHPIDDVELVVLYYAGLFHDDGNAVVDRYQEKYRVAAHAEVGARVFERISEGIVPPNLSLLIQYAIAAHTHYLKDREVESGEAEEEEVVESGEAEAEEKKGVFIVPPYPDEVDEQANRLSVWETRKSDRRDATGVPFIVRNFLVRVEPIEDFNGENFDEKLEREDNFRAQFGLSPEVIGKGIINHFLLFAGNFYKQNDYTTHDTSYFTEQLITPAVEDLAMFLAITAPDQKDRLIAEIGASNPMVAVRIGTFLAINAEFIKSESSRNLSDDEINESLERFAALCRVVEPAEDTEARIESLKAQFPMLPRSEQESWARGLNVISTVGFERWKNNLADSISEARFNDFIASRESSSQVNVIEITRHLQSLAEDVLASMHHPESPRLV